MGEIPVGLQLVRQTNWSSPWDVNVMGVRGEAPPPPGESGLIPAAICQPWRQGSARACCHRPVSRDTPPSSSCKEAPVLGLEITGRSRWCIQSSPWVLDLYKPLGLVLTLLLEQDDRVWVAESQGHFLG